MSHKKFGITIFRSNNIPTWAVSVLFAIYIILTILVVGGLGYSIDILHTLIESPTPDLQQQLLNNLSHLDKFLSYRIYVFIIAVLVFLYWVYRANKNLRALAISGLETTPVWAVISFFIPFVNLFWPYRVLKEIWQASSSNAHWKLYPAHIILVWWVLFLISAFGIYAVVHSVPKTPSDLNVFLWSYLWVEILYIIVCCVGIYVVNIINKRQNEKLKAPK